MAEPAPLKVLYVSSEAAPFSKTGGLADVARDLPRALGRLGADARLFTPRYRGVDPAGLGVVARLSVPVSTRRVEGRVLAREEDGAGPSGGATAYLLDAPEYFDRPGLYGEGGEDYPDNAERFVFFSRAVLEFCRSQAASGGWVPDILHANDWQAALVPVYLKTLYDRDAWRRGVATVLSVHNLAYQGVFWHYDMHLTGLPWSLFTYDKLEFYGKLNLLKGGLVYADLLHTVSPTYAKEILSKEHGHGLDPLLRYREADLRGILNGADLEHWDPATDGHLAAKYDAANLGRKRACKRDLQRLSNLPETDSPVLGSIGRLVAQKGVDLLLDALEEILALDAQVVLLGTGDPDLEARLKQVAVRHPLRTGIHLAFSEELAHKITAGADLFLMPSRYEPCGLNQIYAMRYGTPPVVRRTGGLADTVSDGVTGFVFDRPEPADLLAAVRRAVEAYRDAERWRSIQRAAMARDFSWAASARAYLDLYREALERARR